MEFKEDYYECGHPDAPGPRHIWESPEFSKKNPPSNFWGLHIWRVCNHFKITEWPQNYNNTTWAGKPSCNFPGVNTYTPNTVGPFSFFGNPFCTRYWTGTTWAYNVTSPTPSGYLPLTDYYYTNYFYDWAVQSIGPINVGDKIEFNCCEQQAPWIGLTNSVGSNHPTPMCLSNTIGGSGSGNKLCLEYVGRHYIGGHPLIPNPTGNPTPQPWPIQVGQYYWNGTYMTTSMMSATIYSMLNYPEEEPTCCKSFIHATSWDCVQIGDHPKFGFKCVEVYGASGQYETKQECLRSGCEGINPDPGMPTTQTPPGGFTPLTGGTIGTTIESGGGGEQSPGSPTDEE